MLRQALILSSNREYAQAMRHSLLKLGNDETRVDVELDGLRAMQLAPQQYELILLDTALAQMDGLQLLQMIKHQAPTSKFIIVSDSAGEATRAIAYQSGADFFLERPHTPEAFGLAAEAIRGLLAARIEEPAKDKADPLVRVADIVQMRCLSGDSVLLLVRAKEQSGDIFIFRGDVYHAQYPGKGGESAFHDMLKWDSGLVRVQTVKLAHTPPRTIELPYRELIDAAEKAVPEGPDIAQTGGELFVVAGERPSDTATLNAVLEAPPRENPTPEPTTFPATSLVMAGETALPHLNCHWKVNLAGELLEGSQVAEPERCAFITSFIYRKMADVAVALELDYFNHMTLYGPHLQQVMVADNIGVRHAVFDTAWTTEEVRAQYVKWCCEQSF